MNAWRRCRRLLHTVRMGVRSQPPGLGIVPRLVIAFITAGALLLAAIVIAERSVPIATTIRIAPAVTAPTPPAAVEAMTPKATPPRRAMSSDALLLARDLFAESVKERIEAKSAGSEANYQRAAEDLQRNANLFTAMAASITGKSFDELNSAAKILTQAAAEFVQASDARRDTWHEYSARVEELSTKVKKTSAGSWHLFGRLAAAQASARLSADIEALPRLDVTFGSADFGDTVATTALSKAEEALRKDLEDDQTNLRRAGGDAWYEGVRADAASLAALRDSNRTVQRSLRKAPG